MYGAKKKKLEVSEEMAEAIEDEGSLQYVVYNKKHRSGLAKMKRDWLYPGKIVDDEEWFDLMINILIKWAKGELI